MVGVIRHDSLDDELSVYLCVNSDNDDVETALVFTASASQPETLALPEGASLHLGGGFLEKDLRFTVAASAARASYPLTGVICGFRELDDVALASIVPEPNETFSLYKGLAGGGDVVTLTGVLSRTFPALQVDNSAGFHWAVRPVTKIGFLPVNFTWRNAKRHDGLSQRSVRLDMVPRTPALPPGFEKAKRVVVYLPAGSANVFTPSGGQISFGSTGVRRIVIPVDSAAQTVEVDWTDEALSAARDFLLLLSGVALGFLASLVGGLVFARPRWRNAPADHVTQRPSSRRHSG
jgi:hypothetical protein